MSVNNIGLLKYTVQKSEAVLAQKTAGIPVLDSIQDEDFLVLNDRRLGSDLCGNLSDDKIIEYIGNLNNNIDDTNGSNKMVLDVQPQSEPAVVGNFVTAEDIKNKIFAYRHPQITISLYKNNFDEICNMLNINPEHGIKKRDLYTYTQIDSQEDANNDFIGSLNRVFFDKELDDEITYKDLQYMFMRMAGTDCKIDSVYDYKSLVNKYSDEIQSRYSVMTTSEKLDFIIDIARDYFDASGTTLGTAALNRMLNQIGTQNTHQSEQLCSRGQIAIADPSVSSAAGTYSSWSYYGAEGIDPNGNSGGQYSATVFYSDSDTTAKDYGITLAESTINYQWIDAAKVLVHELIHSTRYYFAEFRSTSEANYPFEPSKLGLDELHSRKIISDSEYNKYLYNWSSCTTQEKNKLYYEIDCYCGEYNARIQQCKFYDYYASDVFKSGYWQYQVDGPQEEAIIKEEVQNGALYDLKRDATHKHALPKDFSLYA